MGSKVEIIFEKPNSLESESLKKVVRFMQGYSNDGDDEIVESLRDCDRLILYRDKNSGEICGTTRLRVVDLEAGGKACRALITMSVVIAEEYRGQNLTQRAGLKSFLRFGLWTLRRVYWFSLMSGFRAYLLAARYMPNTWPHRNREMSSTEERVYTALLEDQFGHLWDADRGVTRRYSGSMKPEQLQVPSKVRQRDPDVKFFCEQNPGYASGEGLPVLVRLRVVNFIVMFFRILIRSFR